MNPPTHHGFKPLHNVSAMIQRDHSELAHQLQLCRNDHSGWGHLMAATNSAQAFTAQHLISIVILSAAIVSSLAWLIG